MVKIKFRKYHGKYNRDEQREFIDSFARELIDAGIAEAVPVEKVEAIPDEKIVSGPEPIKRGRK